MSVLAPRIRSISVRLSAEEFSAVQRFCVSSGARSISDFARTAICSLANPQTALVSTMKEYSAKVKRLEKRIERLNAEMESFKTGKLA